MAGLIAAPGSEEPHGLLGGRLRLRQPRAGLRAGLDAVMLAALVPLRPGERLLDLGCGPGGVLLCALARVPGARALGVERDPALAALARENAALNGWSERVGIEAGDATDLAARRAAPRADHAACNPPWWPGGTTPPAPLRSGATHAADSDLPAWTAALAAGLRPGGTASLALPAARAAQGASALLAAGLGAVELWPLWPRAGREARRVLLRARLGARGPGRVRAGLVLHGDEGWTAAAEAVLSRAAALDDLA